MASVLLPIALLLVFGLLFALRSIAPRGLMKIGISMLQIIANANSVYSIPWPGNFNDTLNILKVFLVGKQRRAVGLVH